MKQINLYCQFMLNHFNLLSPLIPPVLTGYVAISLVWFNFSDRIFFPNKQMAAEFFNSF